MAIALLLFGCRKKKVLGNVTKSSWPFGIVNYLVASNVDRQGFSITGLIESDYPNAGAQLHIGIKSIFKKREMVLIDCFRIAHLILQLNSKTYDRLLFEIDVGDKLFSSVVINAREFGTLIEKNAKLESAKECIQTSFLWSDESIWRSRVKVYLYMLRTNLALQFYNRRKEVGKVLFSNSEEFEVRAIERQATKDLYRLSIRAVVKPNFDETRDNIRRIIEEITKKHSFAPVKVRKDWFLKNRILPGRPSYIWIFLYRKNGTLRFLKNQGWLGGNLLCNSEWIRGKTLPPICVKNPEEVKSGIRYRFNIDQEEYVKAMRGFKGMFTP